MLHPFIYTGTRYHDFRLVTSKSLKTVSQSIVRTFKDIASTMIDAENVQLVEPSWVLVKKEGYLLWGIAVVNKVLGDVNQDKYNRPARGFFGLISDGDISRLPYSISYFAELYKTYVTPIWDSPIQTEQIECQVPTISGADFIVKSPRLDHEINVSTGKCRRFPSNSDCKALIEAVFASFDDCSIATNIHNRDQGIEFGNDKLSFMNIVMSSESLLKSTEDVTVTVKDEPPVIGKETPTTEDDEERKEYSICSECGKPVYGDEALCQVCKDKQQIKKYLKYGFYVFVVAICLIMLVKGPSIWEMILPPKQNPGFIQHDDENPPISFIRTNKSSINITDASETDVFRIKYECSSKIKDVQSPDWIRIVTPLEKYSTIGDVEFVCEPLAEGSRTGIIVFVNEEGGKAAISISQKTTNK